MAEPNRHSFRTLVLTHDVSSSGSTDGRTGTDRTCDRTRTMLAHHFDAICGDGGLGVLYVAGPVRPAHSAPKVNYHLLGWWSTNRPLLMHNVKRRWVCNRGRLAADNGQALHTTHATGRLMLGREAATLLSTGFWARNH